MGNARLDALARAFARPEQSRRRLVGAALVGLLGGGGVLGGVRSVDAARCKRKCGRGCCPERAPKCCKTYCCRKGFTCCGNKKCCK